MLRRHPHIQGLVLGSLLLTVAALGAPHALRSIGDVTGGSPTVVVTEPSGEAVEGEAAPAPTP